MGLFGDLKRKLRAFSRRSNRYTISDLLTLYTYLRKMEPLCYYDPKKDDRCRNKLYFPNMLACIAIVEKIIQNNPITSENSGLDIFKSGIVAQIERDIIRQMCLEFLHSEHKIAENISKMARSAKPEFQAKADSVIEAFKNLQRLVPITLQKANLE